MAELNNHAVLHEDEDTEDGKCVDLCFCVVKVFKGLKILLNLKRVFLKAVPLPEQGPLEAINKQISLLFSVAESLILWLRYSSAIS